jgi:protein N-terminal methyltransferase
MHCAEDTSKFSSDTHIYPGMPITHDIYTNTRQYWDGKDALDTAMTNASMEQSDQDIRQNEEFLLKSCVVPARGNTRALDCGAGIGRITDKLLRRYFDEVDLVDANARFLDKAKRRLTAGTPHRGIFFHSDLRLFHPLPNRCYDVIWVQWVLMYMKDKDIIAFLKRCTSALKPGGYIIIKENINDAGMAHHALEEGLSGSQHMCMSRPHAHFLGMFFRSGLRVVDSKVYDNSVAPPHIEYFPTKVYLLQPYTIHPLSIIVVVVVFVPIIVFLLISSSFLVMPSDGAMVCYV